MYYIFKLYVKINYLNYNYNSQYIHMYVLYVYTYPHTYIHIGIHLYILICRFIEIIYRSSFLNRKLT